jgi:hypothetical protein
MTFRKLRIAWSAMCGILCLLLIVLWVRSYTWADDLIIRLPGSREFVIHSMQGSTAWYRASGLPPARAVVIESESVERLTDGTSTRASWFNDLLDLQVLRRPVLLPHWIFILGISALSIVPWLRYRFSLRTLLIATTLVAVLLGAMIWAVR